MQRENNIFIVPPKFVALDSSVLGYLSKDFFSSDATKRKNSVNLLKCLSDNAFIPFLCIHQFHELIKIRDDKDAKDRFNFLRLLPQVAWIPNRNDNSLGSILDVLFAECEAVISDNKLSLIAVRDKARSSLIHFGTGIEAMSPYEEIWENGHPYRQHLWKQEERTRQTVAIRRSKVNDISKNSVSSFMNGNIREQKEAITFL